LAKQIISVNLAVALFALLSRSKKETHNKATAQRSDIMS